MIMPILSRQSGFTGTGMKGFVLWLSRCSTRFL